MAMPPNRVMALCRQGNPAFGAYVRIPAPDVVEALAQAGVIPFKLGDAERQLRQIGRHRAKQLTEWLLAADLAMKGHNSSEERARLEIERLIIRLSAMNNEGTSRRTTNSAGVAAATRS